MTTTIKGVYVRRKTLHEADETDGGKYVIIKVPRDKLRKSIYSYFLADAPLENFRKAAWTILCALSFVIGIIVEAIFRWKLF